jgi:methylamine dehydrogenase accessory protein MauD
MSSGIVSQVLLWTVVIIQGVAIWALARQIGMLHERVAPVGALVNMAGPGVGEKSPRMEVKALAGNSITIGAAMASRKSLLMFFVSSTCPICKKLLPIVKDFARSERLEVVYVGDGEAAEQERLLSDYQLDPARFVNGPQIGMAFRVDKLPYTVLLDERGVIVAKGLVNSREHFESLIVARESGYGTLQSYLKAHSEAA